MSGLGAISYIDADNAETILTTQDDLDVIGEIEGHGMPPIILGEEAIPEQPGARSRFVLHGPRDMGVPILVSKTDAVALSGRIRTLAARLDPTRGAGRLRWDRGGGDVREISCRYGGGFSLRQSSVAFTVAVLGFRAPDPYWQDITDQSQGFATGAPIDFFPFFPIVLSGENIIAGVEINNAGDVDAWPVWIINGPGSALVLENETTGESLELSTVLVAGESVTIDTRPGIKTVTQDDGTNLYPDLDPGSSLWPLRRGLNTVSISLTDATGASTVELRYRRRYLTA